MAIFKDVKQKLYSLKDVTFDFVGDSITYGEINCNNNQTYVAHFERLFKQDFSDYSTVRYDGYYKDESSAISRFDKVGKGYQGKPVASFVRNGVGGNTVSRALKRKDNFTGLMPNGKKADVTFLMFGINDALINDANKYVTPTVFGENYNRLIDELLLNGNGNIVMLSATYHGFISIKGHLDVSEKLAKDRNIPYLDLYEIWQRHYEKSSYNFGQGDWLGNGGITNDPCHFSPVSSEINAKIIYEFFKTLVK